MKIKRIMILIVLAISCVALATAGNGNAIEESCRECHIRVSDIPNSTIAKVHHSIENVEQCDICHKKEGVEGVFYSINCEDCHMSVVNYSKQFHHDIRHNSECSMCHFSPPDEKHRQNQWGRQ